MRRFMLLGLLFACQDEEPAQVQVPVSTCTADIPAVDDVALAAADASNAFAWAAYEEARQGAGEENLFFSPFSISSALGMTLAGAQGNTADELAAVLWAGDDLGEYHDGNRQLRETILLGAEDCATEVLVANRLFGQAGYPWQAPFLETTSTDYGAPLEEVDYIQDPEGSRTLINDWVADQTADHIQDLIPAGAISDSVRLVLANAIYFKADWSLPFRESDTRDSPFTLADGSTVTVPMMYRSGQAAVGWSDGVQVLSMPYDGERQSMVVLLPDDPSGLPALEASLGAERLAALQDGLYDQEVDIFFPRFTIEGELPLKATLQQMGVVDAFNDGTADFTGMANEPGERLYIEDAFHKAYIEVNEQGSEAAAATGVVVGTESAPPMFAATHPFVFLIQDNVTGAILFMGRVSDPS